MTNGANAQTTRTGFRHLIIRHYFVIRHSDYVIHSRENEQHSHASLDYDDEQKHEHDSS